MKNIFLIPTDKPSRLYLHSNGKIQIRAELINNYLGNNQHIYITSDEEIKEGDWFECKHLREDIIDKTNKNTDLVNLNNSDKYFRKIILTTDPDLITDEVQAIDDEFLEWFVKNLSCEKVEVEKAPYDGTKSIDKYWGGEYKIIIQKVEPNQDKDEIIDILDHDGIGNAVDNLNNEPLQKTLEEAKLKFCNDSNNWQGSSREDLKLGWDACAKWQQERMFSEEEVLDIIADCDGSITQAKKWFEQFKKK